MANAKTTAPYGKWTSPITAELIAKKSNAIYDVLVDPLTSALYHVERRPTESGRNAIVNSETEEDVFGPGWNARTGVHEYGGSCYAVVGGVVFFVHFADGRVYRVKEGSGEEPRAVTPENEAYRYAELTPHPTHPHIFLSILEDHTKPLPADVVNTLITINTHTSTIHPFASGADFYSSGTFNPSGTRIAWVQWWHPDMPWEGTELVVADVVVDNDGVLKHKNERIVAGERLKVSATQPKWVNDEVLVFTSDETGWINPYIVNVVSGGKPTLLLKEPRTEEFGWPAWQLGDTYYTILSEKTGVFSALLDGKSILYHIDLTTGHSTSLDCPFVAINHVHRLSATQFAFLGESTDKPPALITATITQTPTHPTVSVTYTTVSPRHVDPTSAALQPYFSTPSSLRLKNPSDGDAPIHVVFYPPHNPDFVAPKGEKPPCVVLVHGGPTGLTTQGLKMRNQFFTSRGWAWVDVNYGGSSGYGREYTNRLVGKWGLTDVSDCVHSVSQLSTPSPSLPTPIDPTRTVITGGSAGGFTVLAALCAFPTTYAAGTSSYGVSDLRKLAEDTHKFESRYLEKLVGGTVEEVPEVYKERSPVFNAGSIRSPLLILQGSIDKVVPPSQAEEMMKIIKQNGGRVEYVLFEGEGHGWRKSENIIEALERELAFYNDVLGL